MGTPLSSDAAARTPRSAPERAWLLLILVVLPVLAVSLPAIIVTAIFGQHPKTATAVAPDVVGLRTALEQNAQQLLTPPPALGEEPIILPVKASQLAARTERVNNLARQWGASVSEGLPRTDGKDLYLDLPSASVAGFRAALAARASDALPPSPPVAASPTPPAADLVHLEVQLRIARDDE